RAVLPTKGFASTSEIASPRELVGQSRAIDAIALGTRLHDGGFNLYVSGRIDNGLRDTVRSMLNEVAAARAAPPDIVYVFNFNEPHKPVALELPTGRASQFRDAMHDLISDLRVALPAAFEKEEYRTRRAAAEETVRKKQVEAFSTVEEKAAQRQLTVVRTPMGFGIAPVHEGQIVPPEKFSTWPPDKREKVQADIRELEQELERVLRQAPAWDKELRDSVRDLNRETAKLAIGHSIDETRAHLGDLSNAIVHLERVRENLIENVEVFIGKAEGEGPDETSAGTLFERYEVNILVTQDAKSPRAPVVEEAHPTLVNLMGRTEYAARQGILYTDFRLIKAGALHRANGGYLILDVRSLLSEPFSWPALKRALRRQKITIEDVAHVMGLAGTISLEPDPVPLDLKVILIGERIFYYLLSSYDPEFREYFKVLADFDEDIPRSDETEAALAQKLAHVVAKQGLRPVAQGGIERIIEHAARLADDADKLSLVTDDMVEIVREADFWSQVAAHSAIERDDVERALRERDRRMARVRERAQESILRGFALIETEGMELGQINGLSILELGGFRFGRPTRITARVRPGSGQVLDIEREVALGGPLHSKGVLILSGFILGRYALDVPISLAASLVFEQSYGGVEGDSASSAELYALLSALGEIPVRQDLAVTGSVNQHGVVQAIGGVNEKIEGFFDICRARGLTGTQGVIIPAANMANLMLRNDVVEACTEKKFSIFSVSTIDEGISILTGLAAGQRGSDGKFAPDSINARIEDRLRAFAAIRRQFAVEPAEKSRSH
ncbi:MAG: AAA family ATPase, partial [Alphaproteobacteria bacterium]|nr:AAA family ATPase [Alphaproteobacteria bacterium]